MTVKYTNPFVLDLHPVQDGWLSKFDGDSERMLSIFNAMFGTEKILYDFTYTSGVNLDSSFKSADLKYSDIEIGQEFLLERYYKHKRIITPVRVINKYQYIIFLESLEDGRKTYLDVGANDYYNGPNIEHYIEKHTIYPIEVIVPKYMDIVNGVFPKETKITYSND